MKKPKILFYDIETSLLGLWTFNLGKQLARHGQLLGGYFSTTHIICISYKWSGSDKVHSLDWGQCEDDEAKMLSEFDAELRKADAIIGKNNISFDDKILNAQRMLLGIAGQPETKHITDDLEKMMRKYFRLPSQSLDYISKKLGLGGKDSMGLFDWTILNEYRLCQLLDDGASDTPYLVAQVLFDKDYDALSLDAGRTLKKMISYNKKDVRDTEYVWNYCKTHFEPKLNMSAFKGEFCCKFCGSTDIKKNGTRTSGASLYQNYYCNECNHYAGKALASNKNTTTLR